MTKQRWFLVTNTENLKFFFECGMIVDEQAFPNQSYMNDIQSVMPKGHLILLSKNWLLKSSALEMAVKDDNNLIATLIEIDLDKLNEKLIVPLCDSESIFTDSGTKILVAPLPLCCIKKIYLKSKDIKNRVIEEFVSAFSDIDNKIFGIEPLLFKNTQNRNLLFDEIKHNISEKLIDYKKTFSLGGVAYLTYYQTKNGKLSCELFDSIFLASTFKMDQIINNEVKNIESDLQDILSWIYNDKNSKQRALFYKSIFDIITLDSDMGTRQYNLINHFKSSDRFDEAWHKNLSKIADDLTNVIHRTGGELSYDEYFNKIIEEYEHRKKGSSRFVLLNSTLFFRDKIETMLKSYHEKFTEEDYYLIAVFWGLIEGILKVPKKIREIKGMRNWVSSLMTDYLHEFSAVKEKYTPKPPLLLHMDKVFSKKEFSSKNEMIYELVQLLTNDTKDILTYNLIINNEYSTIPSSGGVKLEFKIPPKILVSINRNLLDKSILEQIQHADSLFDFNSALEIIGK